MKNVILILCLLVMGFMGIFYYLHHNGAPTEWDRKREAHAQWKQTAIEPEIAVRPEQQDVLMMDPVSSEVELRMPASTKPRAQKK